MGCACRPVCAVSEVCFCCSPKQAKEFDLIKKKNNNKNHVQVLLPPRNQVRGVGACRSFWCYSQPKSASSVLRALWWVLFNCENINTVWVCLIFFSARSFFLKCPCFPFPKRKAGCTERCMWRRVQSTTFGLSVSLNARIFWSRFFSDTPYSCFFFLSLNFFSCRRGCAWSSLLVPTVLFGPQRAGHFFQLLHFRSAFDRYCSSKPYFAGSKS